MVKVSVYIPSHNYGQYIDQAVQSVLKQSMMDWELIVIDDGSTDNTLEILNKYKKHSKIRIIEQENKGLNVTNNIAVRLSNGQYVIRLDADDVFDENILLVLSNILDTKPDVSLVYPDYYHTDETGEVMEIVRRKKIGEEVELLDLPAHGACTMIRRESLRDLRGYEEAFSCQDGYDLWLRFLQKYKPYNVNVPLFYYRQHGNSLTKKQEKILDTRREIKNNFVDKYKNGERPRVLCIIPVAKKSIYGKIGPFDKLSGKPLLWYTLKEANNIKYSDKIILSSEDDEVLNFAGNFQNIITLKRPDELARSNSRIQDTVNYILNHLEHEDAYVPDAVCILYITTPLRKARHVDKAIDTMTIFDVDSVISTQEELAFCYHHRRMGLASINSTKRGGLREFRAERNAIYREDGAVFLSKRKVFENGRLLGEKIGHIEMLPWESVKINSEYEFWLADKLLADRNKFGVSNK